MHRLIYFLAARRARASGVLWNCIRSFGPLIVILVLLAMLLFRGERWFRQVAGLAYGDELLFESVSMNDVPAMRHALREGASPNAAMPSSTALMWAASGGSEDAVLCLLNAGAQVNEMHNLGKTALVDAALTGNVKIVKVLLDHGADPNEYSARVGTPLHAAVVTGNESVVRLLLSRGADPNLALASGETPLDVAEASPQIPESLRACLIAAGARRSGQSA